MKWSVPGTRFFSTIQQSISHLPSVAQEARADAHAHAMVWISGCWIAKRRIQMIRPYTVDHHSLVFVAEEDEVHDRFILD